MAVTRKRNSKKETQHSQGTRTTAAYEPQQQHQSSNNGRSEKENAGDVGEAFMNKSKSATSYGSAVSSNSRTSVELADNVLVKFVRQENLKDDSLCRALDDAKSVS